MWEQGSGSTSTWTMGDPRGVVRSYHIFTQEIHVLLVDHEKETLVSMARMLEFYSYKVTAVQSGSIALSLLSDGNNQFDLVLADIHLPDTNSFRLLQESLNRELPTVLMSAGEDAMVAKIALENGACFFLEKPTSSNVVKNLWQHVIKERSNKAKMNGKKEILHQQEMSNQNETRIWNSEESNLEGKSNSDTNSQKAMDGGKKKGRHIGIGVIADDEAVESDKGSRKSGKKFCTEWTDELHHKFMAAVDHLGEGRCYPKEILELMNVPGLTRMQVASHLQKCRNDNWRAPETRKSNASSAQNNGSPYKFGSRKFGSMPRLQKKSSSNPQVSNSQLEEGWVHQTSPGIYSTPGNNFMGNKEEEYSSVQLIQAQSQMVPNCFGGNNMIPTQNNDGPVGTNGIDNVTYNSAYLNPTPNDAIARNIQNLAPWPTNQNSQATTTSHFGNATFGVDSHSSVLNQIPVMDDFFDFLPEIEGTHGFPKYLGGSTTMGYGFIPDTYNAFDVEPIFFDRLEGRLR